MVSVNQFKFNPRMGLLTLENNSNKILAKANIIETPDRVCLCHLKSYEKNKGYGSQIIEYLKEKFAGKTISLNASWIEDKPPHKFYIDKGFVPKDKNVFEKLQIWIKNGAKLEEFPFPRCDSSCPMTFNT
ncbi:hypothetical protein HDR58_09090 [bacterium]|nr:hypothetical protein [bacterium]